MALRIADSPVEDRPRERLWRLGVQALSDAELVALVLRHGRRGESALELAAALLAESGGLNQLATATPEELAARAGVGRAKAAALLAALDLARRTASRHPPAIVGSAADVADIARAELGAARREETLAVVLGGGNRVRRIVRVGHGGATGAPMPVREILNAVLRNDGVAFAVAHNHPSGDPTPSAADRRATQRLREAARVVGLRFLDHVVVADGGWRRAEATAEARDRP